MKKERKKENGIDRKKAGQRSERKKEKDGRISYRRKRRVREHKERFQLTSIKDIKTKKE